MAQPDMNVALNVTNFADFTALANVTAKASKFAELTDKAVKTMVKNNQEHNTQTSETWSRLRVGVAEYDANMENKISSSKKVIAGVVEAAGTLAKNYIPEYPMHVEIVPHHKSIKEALKYVDPTLAAAGRRDFSISWKNLVHLNGRKLQEGKFKYPVTLFEATKNMGPDGHGRAILQYIQHHKDCHKAYLLWRMHHPELLPFNMSRTFQFCSSKGFHKVLLGRVQKSHKMHKKKHVKAMKYSKPLS